MKLPTTPIEKAYIFYTGDPSVGIPRTSFEMTVFIDLSCYEHPARVLAKNRLAIASLYKCLHGERPYILFDYELEEMNQPQKELNSDYNSLNDWNKEV